MQGSGKLLNRALESVNLDFALQSPHNSAGKPCVKTCRSRAISVLKEPFHRGMKKVQTSTFLHYVNQSNSCAKKCESPVQLSLLLCSQLCDDVDTASCLFSSCENFVAIMYTREAPDAIPTHEATKAV